MTLNEDPRNKLIHILLINFQQRNKNVQRKLIVFPIRVLTTISKE